MINIQELKDRIKGFNDLYQFEIQNKMVGKKTFETYLVKSQHGAQNYIRCTTPLGYWIPPALKNWLQTNTKDQSKEILKVAGNVGSAIHYFIENHAIQGDVSKDQYVLAQEESNREQIDNGISAFEAFWKEESFEIVGQEVRLISPKYGTAGTIDMIAVRGNDLCVMDWKSGFYKPTYGWQLAMYGQMVEEHFGIKPKLMAIILDKRSGKATKIEFEHNDFLLSCYLGILQAYAGENWKALGEFWPWHLNILMKGNL